MCIILSLNSLRPKRSKIISLWYRLRKKKRRTSCGVSQRIWVCLVSVSLLCIRRIRSCWMRWRSFACTMKCLLLPNPSLPMYMLMIEEKKWIDVVWWWISDQTFDQSSTECVWCTWLYETVLWSTWDSLCSCRCCFLLMDWSSVCFPWFYWEYSKYMKGNTFEDEMELWRYMAYEGGVVVSPVYVVYLLCDG